MSTVGIKMTQITENSQKKKHLHFFSMLKNLMDRHKKAVV